MLGKVFVAGLLVAGAFVGCTHLMADEAELAGVGSNSAGTDARTGPTRTAGTRFVATVDRAWDDEGELYRVRPTRRGRLVAPDELPAAWRQAVRAGVPDRPGLRQQFYCHPLSLVARAKPTWDLEVWRPEVGLTRTMLAGCNPV